MNKVKLMKIAIIGGGSLGLLYAYYLNQKFDVKIYTRTREQAEILNREGLWLEDFKGKQMHTTISAKVFEQWQGSEDVAIVTVKQYQLESVLNKILLFSEKDGRVLFLQNGMGHIKLLENLPNHEIYIGSVEHGAYRESANLVHHNGEGVTKLAVYKGDSIFLRKLIEQFPANFPSKYEPDYYEMLIQKLIVNAVVNPLTAVLNVRNGELVSNPFYFQVLKSLFLELKEALMLNKENDYFQHIIRVCENTAKNRSSMLKDLEQNRQTEIDAILGFVVKETEHRGIHAPLLTTFYQLVKGKERKAEEK